MKMRMLDNCVCCGACESYCPVGAIYEGEDRYCVDYDKCINCGACEAACPVDNIKCD